MFDCFSHLDVIYLRLLSDKYELSATSWLGNPVVYMNISLSATFTFTLSLKHSCSRSLVKAEEICITNFPSRRNPKSSSLYHGHTARAERSLLLSQALPVQIYTHHPVRDANCLQFVNVQERPSPLNHFFPKHKSLGQQRKVVFFHLHNSCYFKSIL